MSAVAEKVSGSVPGEKEPWEFGTYASTTVYASFGSPLTGRYLDATYTVSARLAGESESIGALDQEFSLTGLYNFAKLMLSVTGDYAHSSGPDRDVGSAVDRDLVSVGINASYPVSAKTSLTWAIGLSTSSYAEGINSEELRTSLSLGRRISVKTMLGVGATAGTVIVGDEGDDQTFQQINLQGAYHPSSKLGVSASIGYELRQAGSTTSAAPIFSGGLSYALRPTTSVNLAASSLVASSAAETSTNYTSTTVQASLSQSLGRRFSTSLALGYQTAVYDALGHDAESGRTSREDRYYFLRPDLQMEITESFGVSLSYSYGTNRSNERPFDTQQISLSGTYSF